MPVKREYDQDRVDLRLICFVRSWTYTIVQKRCVRDAGIFIIFMQMLAHDTYMHTTTVRTTDLPSYFGQRSNLH